VLSILLLLCLSIRSNLALHQLLDDRPAGTPVIRQRLDICVGHHLLSLATSA
jgi:hypothetical protein